MGLANMLPSPFGFVSNEIFLLTERLFYIVDNILNIFNTNG